MEHTSLQTSIDPHARRVLKRCYRMYLEKFADVRNTPPPHIDIDYTRTKKTRGSGSNEGECEEQLMINSFNIEIGDPITTLCMFVSGRTAIFCVRLQRIIDAMDGAFDRYIEERSHHRLHTLAAKMTFGDFEHWFKDTLALALESVYPQRAEFVRRCVTSVTYVQHGSEDAPRTHYFIMAPIINAGAGVAYVETLNCICECVVERRKTALSASVLVLGYIIGCYDTEQLAEAFDAIRGRIRKSEFVKNTIRYIGGAKCMQKADLLYAEVAKEAQRKQCVLSLSKSAV